MITSVFKKCPFTVIQYYTGCIWQRWSSEFSKIVFSLNYSRKNLCDCPKLYLRSLVIFLNLCVTSFVTCPSKIATYPRYFQELTKVRLNSPNVLSKQRLPSNSVSKQSDRDSLYKCLFIFGIKFASLSPTNDLRISFKKINNNVKAVTT